MLMNDEVDVDTEGPVFVFRGVSKSFGAVNALYDIDLEIGAGETVGLVGDNGAGKSTLIKIASGVHQPSSGEIHMLGREVRFANPAQARAAGIETVYQDLALVDQLDAAGNVYLGREQLKSGIRSVCGLLDFRAMREKTMEVLEGLHINIPGIARRPVGRMSGGQRQAVAVARAVAWGGRLLLLDEPTAALGVAESAEVNRIINKLREARLSLMIVSHNLEHVFSVSDRIVVLRHGRKVAEVRRDETSPEEVVGYITGAGLQT